MAENRRFVEKREYNDSRKNIEMYKNQEKQAIFAKERENILQELKELDEKYEDRIAQAVNDDEKRKITDEKKIEENKICASYGFTKNEVDSRMDPDFYVDRTIETRRRKNAKEIISENRDDILKELEEYKKNNEHLKKTEYDELRETAETWTEYDEMKYENAKAKAELAYEKGEMQIYAKYGITERDLDSYLKENPKEEKKENPKRENKENNQEEKTEGENVENNNDEIEPKYEENDIDDRNDVVTLKDILMALVRLKEIQSQLNQAKMAKRIRDARQDINYDVENMKEKINSTRERFGQKIKDSSKDKAEKMARQEEIINGYKEALEGINAEYDKYIKEKEDERSYNEAQYMNNSEKIAELKTNIKADKKEYNKLWKQHTKASKQKNSELTDELKAKIDELSLKIDEQDEAISKGTTSMKESRQNIKKIDEQIKQLEKEKKGKIAEVTKEKNQALIEAKPNIMQRVFGNILDRINGSSKFEKFLDENENQNNELKTTILDEIIIALAENYQSAKGQAGKVIDGVKDKGQDVSKAFESMKSQILQKIEVTIDRKEKEIDAINNDMPIHENENQNLNFGDER